MARSIWNGTIMFGLAAVPVKVHSAVEDRGVHFHQVHAKDGARVKQKRICSKEGKAVPYKQVAKGYEVRGGEFVILTQEEIDAAAGERSHVIELEEFVRAGDIDPVYYDRSYYLGAGKDGRDTYRDRVLELIEMKARGEEPDVPEEPEPQDLPDLMAALEASLARSGRGGSSRAGKRRKRRKRSKVRS